MEKGLRREFRNDSFDLVDFVIRHIRILIVTAVAAALISAAVSLLIRPLYESTATIFPSSNITGAATLLGDTPVSSQLLGNEDATEKLIQVIGSQQIRDYLMEAYDLISHYNIKPGERYPRTVLSKKMDKYLRFSKGPFGAVIIRVRDHDREVACAMANDIAARADTIFNTLRRNVAAVILHDIEESYMEQERLVMQYEDSLSRSSGSTFLRLYSTLEAENSYLGLIRGKHIEALAMSRQTLPYTLVVDHAVVAEKKVWPKRSAIVILSAVSALLLMMMVLFAAEGFKLHRSGDDGQ